MAKKKVVKAKCVFPGCVRPASNVIGLRLRHNPGPNSLWTHDTAGHICDEHAKSGLAFSVDVSLHSNGKKIYSEVSHMDGEKFERESDINPPKRKKTAAE